jgi:hypothetical protein
MQPAKTGKTTYDRKVFIERFMHDAGLSYVQACSLYRVMCRVFEDAVITGNKVTIGRLGALVPKWRPPRDYHMHFVRKGGTIKTGIHRVYYSDGRLEYRLKLYRKFLRTRQLNWVGFVSQ